MKILINDFETEKEKYIELFRKMGYEENEVIFCNSFEQSKNFIENQLEINKLHIDAIITNESSQDSTDILGASQLLSSRSSNMNSYSKGNFRICSIPIILYSNNESKERINLFGYDANISKREYLSHEFLGSELENQIRGWRERLAVDIEILGLRNKDLSNFNQSLYYKNTYQRKIANNALDIFMVKTRVVSKEFINLPSPLNYDWLLLRPIDIEKAVVQFNQTYNRHKKYNRRNNERTILHDFFNKNKMILLREAYADLDYEKNLYDLNGRTSEECDFILKTEYPDFLKTTFFEVKKEDVTFYVKKGTKRPQLSSNFMSHLEQVWRYKEFSENEENQSELESKLGYETRLFDHILLAGRKEEKLEMKEKFESHMNRMYNGIQVITYEELEELNISYYEKFSRLNSDIR